MRGLVLALCLSLAAGPARAATKAPESSDAELGEAMRHFEQGVALYEEGDYAAALFEFEKAYETKPDYRLLYNIGVTALELKDYASARDAFSRYLEDGGAEIEADRRAEVEGQLETLATRVGMVALECNLDGAVVLVDGEQVGLTPLAEPLVLNLGQHRIEVIGADDHAPYEAEVEVTGGSSTTLVVSLARMAEPQPRVDPRVDAPPSASSRVPKLRTATFVMLGVTAAAGAGLAVAGALALRADDELQSELDRFPGDDAALTDAKDRRALLSTTSNVMVGVTAAFAAVTIGLGVATAVVKRREDSGSARARVTPGGFELRF